MDRLLSGARSIVRVRKAGHAADDASLEALIGRMEAAIKDGRLADVLANAKKLPPKAALAGEDWIRKVEARQAVEQAMAEVEAPAQGIARRTPGRAQARRTGRQTMIRIVAFLVVILAAAAGLHWLADRPGTIVVEWQGYVAETSVFRAFVILVLAMGLVMLAWAALRALWSSPAAVGRSSTGGGSERGLDALSSGMIAIGAGDGALAIRYAGQARKSLPNEPLTHLLRAQTAQLAGDRATSRRIFEAMLSSPDTEQLGLRGLFLEAEREGEREAARQFAERALKLNPKLAWPVEALFDLQCQAEDWQGALDTLAIGAAQQPDRQDGGRPPARRAADRAGAGRWRIRPPTRPSSWRARRIGWRRTWCRPRPSPAACWPRRATRRVRRACCSGPGGSRRIPTSPRPMPTPVPATARATGSTACATWRA